MTTHPDGEPTGELTLRTLAMPADANAAMGYFRRLGDGADGSCLRHARRRARQWAGW
jgi:hypothetical protein